MNEETFPAANYPEPPEPPVKSVAARPEPPPIPQASQAVPVVKKRRGRKKKVVATESANVRVRPVHPYMINIYTQGIIIPPGRDAQVVLDKFVESQIAAGVLALSS